MANEKFELNNIPAEKFEFVQENDRLHDKKLETKPIGYFKDAFIRFCKNKASIVGAIIVALLILYSLIGPFCIDKNYTNAYATDTDLRRYQYLLPKIALNEGSGFWDGTEKKEINKTTYYRYEAIGIERGRNPIQKLFGENEIDNGETKTITYTARVSSYYNLKVFVKQFSEDEYLAMQQYQNDNNVQIILPWVDYYDKKDESAQSLTSKVMMNDLDIWFQCDALGSPTLDENGEFIPGYRRELTKKKDSKNPGQFVDNVKDVDKYNSLRISTDPGAASDYDPSTHLQYEYAQLSGSAKTGYSYNCRIDPYEWFVYKFGHEPAFIFGTDGSGYDIFTRLASGGRFSLLFAIAISAINLVIGAIYGAIEGYYGGAADMVMERVSDILASVPTMIVTVLFNLHLSGKVGTVPALLFAFIMTGWIGMASTVRMQFYRFKNQEYVLAARTLGASDRRIMFKHIFPNSLGTIITGTVLVIPGVIFSETSLTYLGIINLDSPTRSSVGAMLSNGQSLFTKYPHLVLFPALFIGLLMVSFNLFGNGLRDAFNPSLRGSED